MEMNPAIICLLDPTCSRKSTIAEKLFKYGFYVIPQLLFLGRLNVESTRVEQEWYVEYFFLVLDSLDLF